MSRATPEVRRYVETYQQFEGADPEANEQMVANIREIFFKHGLVAEYEAILDGLLRHGIDPNNPAAWQIAMTGGQIAATRKQVERTMAGRRRKS